MTVANVGQLHNSMKSLSDSINDSAVITCLHSRDSKSSWSFEAVFLDGSAVFLA